MNTSSSIVLAGATGGLVTIKAAASGDWVITMPVTYPAVSGYVLSCTTTGVTSWVAQGTPTSYTLTAGTGLSGTVANSVLAAVSLSINQAFTPTWSAQHIFSVNPQVSSASTPGYRLYDSAGSADNRKYWIYASTNTFMIGNANDAESVISTAFQITRSGTSTTTITLAGTINLFSYAAGPSFLAIDASKNIVALALTTRTLNSQFTDVGNVGSGVDDLMTYTLPAGMLATNGDRVKFRASLALANNANVKNINFLIGGQSIVSLNSIIVFDQMVMDYEVVRVDSTTVRVNYVATRLATGANYIGYVSISLTLANTQVILVTGEGVANNDIVQKTMSITYFAAP
jgi:hypothetical protein